MTFEHRIERFTERHEALTQLLERMALESQERRVTHVEVREA
jgi:hypothetical protein